MSTGTSPSAPAPFIRMPSARSATPVRPTPTSPAWTLDGDQAGATFGASAASAGDINNDGFSDLLVGAPLYDNVEVDEGRVYLYLGSASGLSLAPAWTSEADQALAHQGQAVSSAGDVNADGFSDVAIGSPAFDNGNVDEGRVAVFLGSATGLALLPTRTLEVNQTGASFGASIAPAGDVNGDGYADILIGAPLYDGGQTDEGRAYLFPGQSGGVSANNAWTAEANQARAQFGAALSSAGDVNGDGYADVIVGAPGYDNGQTDEGSAYTYLGASTGLLATAMGVVESDQASANLGSAVACAGDVQGDGYGDVLVGAAFFDGGEVDEGKAFLYLGGASGLAATASWAVECNQAGALLGYRVAAAGDINDDGFSDVLISAVRMDVTRVSPALIDAGVSLLYLGSPTGLATTPAWTLEGDQSGAYLGSSLGAAGDTNGDGTADLLVGASGYDGGILDEGKVWLYFGNFGDGQTAHGTLRPQVQLPGSATPVPPGGASSTQGAFDLALLSARSPYGRSPLAVQAEARALGSPFDGLTLTQAAAYADSGRTGKALEVPLTGLSATAYHWRERVRIRPSTASPMPWTRWVYGGAPGEARGLHTRVRSVPSLSPVAAQTTTVGKAVTVTLTLSDRDTASSLLTVTSSSSNTTLVPSSGQSLTGTGTSRTLTVTPAANQTGSAVITVRVSDGSLSGSTRFTLTVGKPNQPPVLGTVAAQTLSEDTPSAPISVSVSDPDTASSSLLLSASAGNKTLLPDAGLVLGGSGSTRTLTLTPAMNQNGSTTVTLTLSDGTLSTTSTFSVSVSAVNDAPTLTSVVDLVLDPGVSSSALPFTVADAETAAGSLSVTATSSNTTLLPASGVVLGGSGSTRTVTLTPASGQSGVSTVTLQVSDGSLTAKTSFNLTVSAVTTKAPTISALSAQTTLEDTPTAAIPFTVADADTALSDLLVFTASSNTALLPVEGIRVEGTGSSRTVRLTPQPNQNGSTEVTLLVSDGLKSASTTFTLTVTSVNDGPSISPVGAQVTQEDYPTGAIAFSISDPDQAPGSLTVTASSSSSSLLPTQGIALSGVNRQRAVVLTPTPDKSGQATVTLTVSDGKLSASTAFTLTVQAQNDPPSLVALTSLTLAEDQTSAPVAITLSDVDTVLSELLLTAVSSNPVLLPSSRLTLGGSGASRSLVLSPALDQSGSATVTLTVSDGSLTSSSTLLVTVSAVNDLPHAVDDAFTLTEDVPLEVPRETGLLSNDSDVDSSTLSARLISPSEDGLVTLSTSGSFRFQPDPDWEGETSFTYQITDGSLLSAPATVTLTVLAENDPPEPSPDAYAVSRGSLLNLGPEAGILANDVDVDGDLLTVSLLTAPTLGTLVLYPDGSLTYAPHADAAGVDRFTYRVSDGEFTVDDTQVQITVSDQDSDQDGFNDLVDDCPDQADPDQLDSDTDGVGDACDPCPADTLNDVDGDQICDSQDNCSLSNPSQEDFNDDGIGDACDGRSGTPEPSPSPWEEWPSTSDDEPGGCACHQSTPAPQTRSSFLLLLSLAAWLRRRRSEDHAPSRSTRRLSAD